ncbi:MAG: F0F1 ATP synthase subunit B [Cytophagales bacterium]|nr:F0F1 ATP synthase subunit B [Cytophagales bacterium]
MGLVTPSLGLIFWQVVIFLITLFVLGKYAWKPIMAGLREREENISNALLAADKARKDMAQLKADNESLIQEARREREKILADAQQVAKAIKESAKEEAKREAGRLVEEARAAIQAEKSAALVEVKNQVAAFSLDIAEKVIRKNLADDKEQTALIEGYVKDLNLN